MEPNGADFQWRIDKSPSEDPIESKDPIEKFILQLENVTLVYNWYWLHFFKPETRLCTRTTYSVGNGSEEPEPIIYMSRGRVYASSEGYAGFGTQFIYPNLAQSIKRLEPHINAFRSVPTHSPWNQNEILLLEWLVSQQDRIARGEVTRADNIHFETDYHVDDAPLEPIEVSLRDDYERGFRCLWHQSVIGKYPHQMDIKYFLEELREYDSLRLKRGEISLVQLCNLNPKRMKAVEEAIERGQNFRELGYLPSATLEINASEPAERRFFSIVKKFFSDNLFNH